MSTAIYQPHSGEVARPHSFPPLPEKQVPLWLDETWEDAFETLEEVDTWIVIGYSLPIYDVEVRRLFSAAAHSQYIEILDPRAEEVASAFAEVAPGAFFTLRDGIQDKSKQPPGAQRQTRRRL